MRSLDLAIMTPTIHLIHEIQVIRAGVRAVQVAQATRVVQAIRAVAQVNNIKNQAVIFDIDGTLANVEHRTHWVRSQPKNWPAFNRAMVFDTVYPQIVELLKMYHAWGYTILIASGRGDDTRDITINWLDNVVGLAGWYSQLYMRSSRDSRPDDIVKSEILDQMYLDGHTPTIVVDDRPSVLRMWRDRGLFTFAVGPQEEF